MKPLHRKLRVILLLAALSATLLVALYHGIWFLHIGNPVSVTLQYSHADSPQWQTKELSAEERTAFRSQLCKTTPFFFLHHTSIGAGFHTENMRIILNYADGSSKSFTTWGQNRYLYQGDCGDMVYGEMMGRMLHYGGATSESFRQYVAELAALPHLPTP